MQNCYNTKKLPRELLDFQDERLTTKHIETLSFLQDVGRENKVLKIQVSQLQDELSNCAHLHKIAEEGTKRIKEIQEQYLKKADEVTHLLVEKHTTELLKKEEDRLIAEKDWQEHHSKLLEEIEQLKKVNRELLYKLQAAQNGQNIIPELEERVAGLQQQLDDVTESRDKLEKIKDNQLAEIKRLRVVESHNNDLLEEVKEVNQKYKELQFRLSRLQREVDEAGQAEQEDMLAALRAKLGKLLKDKELWERREQDYQKQIHSLQEENARLRHALSDSERMRGEMNSQMQEVSQEVISLRRQSLRSADQQTFRDFVSMKRELTSLREENQQLKIQLKLLLPSGDKRIELPRLKEDVKINRKPKRTELALK